MHYILILSVLGVTIWARRNYLPIIVCLQKGEYQRGLRHWYSSFLRIHFPPVLAMKMQEMSKRLTIKANFQPIDG